MEQNKLFLKATAGGRLVAEGRCPLGIPHFLGRQNIEKKGCKLFVEEKRAMSARARNLFVLFGIAAIVVMLFTVETDYDQIGRNLSRIGMYFPLVLLVWCLVYGLNSLAFQWIVNSGKHGWHLSLRYACKLTVSGHAFSDTTPLGIGGGPYRMMELSRYIGVPDAMSSVVYYMMTHFYSFFFLWSISIGVFLCLFQEKMKAWLWPVFGIYLLCFLLLSLVFYYGYKNGLIVKLYSILLKIPFIKIPAGKFYDRISGTLCQVDERMAYLYGRPKALWGGLCFEILGRLVAVLEYNLIFQAFGLDVSYAEALLVAGFSSFFDALLYVVPMQIGAREGGLAIIVKILGISTGGAGLLAGFYTRAREFVWICIGVLLVKCGNASPAVSRKWR